MSDAVRCDNCRTVTPGRNRVGWLTVTLHVPWPDGRRYPLVGDYCTAECLAEAAGRQDTADKTRTMRAQASEV